jgi:hypothetical protein
VDPAEELPDETVVLRSILPDDAPSISGINTIPPLSNGPRRSLRLRKKSQANQPKGKALPTPELNGESKGIPMLDLRGIQQVYMECSREPCKI